MVPRSAIYLAVCSATKEILQCFSGALILGSSNLLFFISHQLDGWFAHSLLAIALTNPFCSGRRGWKCPYARRIEGIVPIARIIEGPYVRREPTS